MGRGILLDMARLRGKDVLDVAETFTHEDLKACAEAQGAEIQKHDMLIIRTGWIAKFYKVSREEFYGNFVEPGLTYSPELVQWFHDMEIPNLVTDTIANEVTVDPVSGVVLPLHNALMRNLGITLTEIAWLETWPTTAPPTASTRSSTPPHRSRSSSGTGAPVNPSSSSSTPEVISSLRRYRHRADAPWLARYDPGMPHHIEPEFDNALAMFRGGRGSRPDAAVLQYFDRTLTMARGRRGHRRAGRGRWRPRLPARDRLAVYLQNVPQFVAGHARHVEGRRDHGVDQPHEQGPRARVPAAGLGRHRARVPRGAVRGDRPRASWRRTPTCAR